MSPHIHPFCSIETLNQTRMAVPVFPTTSKEILAYIYGTVLPSTIETIRSRFSVAMNTTNTSISHTIKKTRPIDCGTHFEIDGWKVSKENLWEPTLPEGSIQINPGRACFTVPQAWCRIHSGELVWYYNEIGAMNEIEHRWEYAPSPEELFHVLSSISWNDQEKATALNMPLAGCRTAEPPSFFIDKAAAYLWTFLPYDQSGKNGHCVSLYQGNGIPSYFLHNRARGLSVRSFLEKKWV